ncbi:hypothetical protein C3747_235g1 [Trypanosoma cruzi]|uniref:Uncharacterized protein n=1 Tax=Trypanosoma cruzi TaxID=5693 RepID=A0A2V2VR76_TRYCR|nr:hypothetical protein C3747_235g1 [Trypanosoma cruzi]
MHIMLFVVQQTVLVEHCDTCFSPQSSHTPFTVNAIILPLSSRGGGSNTEGHAEREALLPLITTMAGIFLTTLSENGAHEEGIKTLNNLLAVLPTKCHKVFRTYEAQFRSNLGLSTAQLVNKVRGGDPEIEAAVWVAIAKNAAANADSTKSWLKALEVLERKPLQRADALLQMAEWMATRNAVSRHELITLLLSALDSVERFSDPQMSRLPEESMRKKDLRDLCGKRWPFLSQDAPSVCLMPVPCVPETI